jgi:hypothetical protein
MVCPLPSAAGTFLFVNNTAHRTLARSAPDQPKEVARMIKNPNPMTAQRPSGLVMPTSASLAAAFRGTRVDAATGMSSVAVSTATTPVARVRYVAGDALVIGAFPGLTAWSPPTC